ncbi:MAG: GHKL domain-containing protein [Mobilitalea sp.]
MKNAKHRKILLILGFMLFMLIPSFPVICTNLYHELTGAPEAMNGSVDLTGVELTKDKLHLDGEWEFYWNKFLITDNELGATPDCIIQVPDEWSHYRINGEKLTAAGYASYKLTMTKYTDEREVTIYMPDFGEAYRVFVDGKLTAESGILSKNNDDIFTVPKAEIYPIMLTPDSPHEVVIEVATTRFSGLYMSPILFDYDIVIKNNNLRNALRYILFGVVLFSFVSLIMVYLRSIRKKINSFWLPMMILLLLLRIMLTSEFYAVWQPVLFFNTSYEATNELMYFISFVLKYLLIYLVQEQCGIAFTRKERLSLMIYYIILYLVYLLAPTDFYNDYLSVIVPLLSYVLDIYLYIKIYHNRGSLKKFGMPIFWCTIILIVGLGIDSLYINGKIYWNMSLILLFLCMVFLLAMNTIFNKRMEDIFDDFTTSASRLELANNQIAMQKEYYDALSAQMNEIREIKHDVRHFTGVLGQLAEEGQFDKLKEFLFQYSEQIKMDQLPVFCDNTIANSIIGFYYLSAKKYDIPFDGECIINKQSQISDSDLCIVLGNALENAIYACRQMEPSQHKFVSIDVKTVNGYCLIKVTNTYNGQLIIREGRYISAKGGSSHGLGIGNMEKVVNNYGGFVKIDHDEEVFTIMIAIPDNARES